MGNQISMKSCTLVSDIGLFLTLSKTSAGFYVSAVQVVSNTVGKGEIAHYKQFLLFPHFFLPVGKIFCLFLAHLST